MENVRTHYGSVSAHNDTNEKFTVDYFLLKSFSGEEERIIYGFEVLKINCDGVVIEEVKITDFTGVEEIAEKFLNQITKGLVTPVTLFDVIEDFLGVQYGI